MTATTRRQLVVLAGLVVVLAIVAYLQLRSDDPVPPATAPAAGAPQPSNQAASGGGAEVAVTDVRLDALKQTGRGLEQAERNPFRFRPKAPPPAPAPARQAAPEPAFVPPPVAAGPPPPPPIPLRYVGFLSPTQADRVAVLSDARGTPIYGREGDIIEGRYRVLRIAPDSVDVAYADGRGRQTLRLSSQ